MTDATKKIMAVLQQRGYRITKARAEIVEVLARSRQPCTIQEIVDLVVSDEASVYRNIRVLQAEGLVEMVHDAAGQFHYALSTHHHHHAVCTQCKKIAHIPCMGRETNICISGFPVITDHEVTYYGLCEKCA